MVLFMISSRSASSIHLPMRTDGCCVGFVKLGKGLMVLQVVGEGWWRYVAGVGWVG